jgi:predicted nucleotidyltransferase
VDTAFAALPKEYPPLLSRVAAELERDARVLALFLGGSLGRGVADAGSDLDLLVTVSDEHFDQVAEAIGRDLADVIDPVITLPIPGMPGSFAYTTTQCLRLDLVLERVSEVDRPGFRRRVVVFDRGDITALISQPVDLNHGPDPTTLQGILQEFHRQQAMFPAVVARQDWLLGQEGVHNARLMLYQLFVEANQPLPAMGVKQWSSRLTTEQRNVLAALDPPPAARAPVIAAMTSVRSAFRTVGRATAEEAGATWPTEMDAAVNACWRREGLAG